jgi:RNA polymerase sigma-70 factor (ECF subfamily)
MSNPMSSPSSGAAEIDDVTLARAQRGDETSFRTLVVTYQRRVYDLVWRLLSTSPSQDRVEDLTQETFVRVFRALERFDPAGAARLSTWILTIATRVALSELRRRPPTSVPLESVAELEGGDSSAARRVRLGRAIALAIGALEPKQRVVLVLREYHGFDYQEIADALDVRLDTVKSRLSRARATMRGALEEVRHD